VKREPYARRAELFKSQSWQWFLGAGGGIALLTHQPLVAPIGLVLSGLAGWLLRGIPKWFPDALTSLDEEGLPS
jgi:hypothetical protein